MREIFVTRVSLVSCTSLSGHITANVRYIGHMADMLTYIKPYRQTKIPNLRERLFKAARQQYVNSFDLPGIFFQRINKQTESAALSFSCTRRTQIQNDLSESFLRFLYES